MDNQNATDRTGLLSFAEWHSNSADKDILEIIGIKQPVLLERNARSPLMTGVMTGYNIATDKNFSVLNKYMHRNSCADILMPNGKSEAWPLTMIYINPDAAQ